MYSVIRIYFLFLVSGCMKGKTHKLADERRVTN